MSVRERVRTYLIENIAMTDRWDLDDSASLLQAEILDSTSILELVSFLEQTFGIEIPDEDITREHMDSVAAMVAYVEVRTALPPR